MTMSLEGPSEVPERYRCAHVPVSLLGTRNPEQQNLSTQILNEIQGGSSGTRLRHTFEVLCTIVIYTQRDKVGVLFVLRLLG